MQTKIGLWTWFKDENYGTALQCTALYNILKKYGDVEVIDYIYNKSGYINSPRTIFLKLKDIVYRKFGKNTNPNILPLIYGELFNKYRTSFLKLSSPCISDEDLSNLNKVYDLFVCGSDQIWTTNILNTHNFLDFVKNNNIKVAYAPSFGVSEISFGLHKTYIKRLISSFKYLSVREKTGAKIIKKYTGRDAKVVLDPTLLLSINDWNEILNLDTYIDNSKYILAYFLGDNEDYWKQTEKVSMLLKLPLKIIPVRKKDFSQRGNVVLDVDPCEFVNLIKNAQFVCTDSFHALAFSVNFKKKFCCFLRFSSNDNQSQNSRVIDFLHLLHLEKQIYNGNLNQVLYESSDMDLSYSVLEKLRYDSLLYLEHSINQALKCGK